ncbi:MAG: ATP-binding protein [Salinivirgaceae bacterium]|nr:ATP-binding protein [Salinivirgaceae bacterium]
MRYLNKIVFINSAHVPYAEIKLDGNVHFIGTQGVGKSTLLRAILFFYNVDKSKLGIKIQAGQKSYDEFYLPKQNSYIIYEVCRETGTFFVMTFMSAGRTAFRIVDCQYDKKFFIEDDGNVLYEWGRISERIGTRIFKSNIIRSYEEFRDIIYGNLQNVDKSLRRFNILESAKYQNVPRTIQNIFLNQSLESRVIKDTIIDSMDFANDSIDLNFYREHVKNFRQQYDDIWKWYKREKNGKIKVQSDAENVISKYSLFEYTRKEITELCGKLSFALQRDKERMPILAQKESECSQKLSRQRRLLNEENDKFTRERDTLNGREAVIDNFLKQVKAKRQHYGEIGIENIAEKISKEGELKIREESLKHQESTITDKNRDVKAKYDELQKDVDNQLREYNLQAQQQLNDIERTATGAIAHIREELSKKQENINESYRLKFNDNQEKFNQATQEKNDLKLKEQSVRQMNPYKNEMDELAKSIQDFKDLKSVKERESAQKQKEIDRITHETELARKDLENKCEKDIQLIENEISTTNAKIQKCDELIGKQKGSLIEWLGTNVAKWEQNIGKILDEETVLYNTTLNPQLVTDSNSIYGVKIDVENIEKNIRTPEEIQKEKLELEQNVSNLKNKIAGRRQQLETDIAELTRKPAAQLKTLRMEKTNIDAECNQIPVRIENATKKLNSYEEKLRDFRDKELEEIHNQLGKIEAELEAIRKQKQDFETKRLSELDTLRKEFDTQKKIVDAEKETNSSSIKTDISQKEQTAKQQKKELEAQMDAELKGLGVDVKQLAAIREQLQLVANELTFIEQYRSEYVTWQNDTKEFFLQEQAKKEEQRLINQKLADLQEKFNLRKQKLVTEIGKLEEELRKLQNEQSMLNLAIENTESFITSSSCPIELTTVQNVETVAALSIILNDLKNKIISQQQKMVEFKQSVTTFKSNFSPQNTFHFRTDFNDDADYMEFAADLNDFLSNKKIEEYRVRTSNQYASIIRRIAKEVSDLSQHIADIKATINDINNDFSANNFAGVIKDIKLRDVESNDRLMQQLLNIKQFDDEHNFDIGELNLFSTEDTLARTNEKAVNLLMTLIELMDAEQKRENITLSDTFKLEFKVIENDNDTKWVEKLSNVGSDGTDILVKAMVNIMLINVFKKKISRKFGDFKLHCMMDEIGKLHPDNVEGILKFANVRNIYLINSSPTTYNAQAYKYTYSLCKDEKNNTVVKTLLTIR